MLNYSSEKKVSQKVGQKVGQRKIKSIKKAFKLLKLKGFFKFIKRRERFMNLLPNILEIQFLIIMSKP